MRYSILMFTLWTLLPQYGWTDDARQTLKLRVMTYNIHHGEGMDGKIDLPRLARVIKEANPDLVALQEVDQRCTRSGKVEQTAELSRLTGLHGRFAKQIPYEGGEYGQAILSRYPISEVTIHWLPGMPDREQRIVASVMLEVSGQKIQFATTHLHHNSTSDREQQALKLNELLPEPETLSLLAGDLNAVPDSKVLQILGEEWLIGPPGPESYLTFPADSPQRQLDYILVNRSTPAVILSQRVIGEAVASDHRPLVVEIKINR